ncbi:hypothetical protein QIS74_01036 [Colletotrichum tabaci]|uniref:Peptidase S8/S53 domain-containing protein n=1 Tax=Colletotrichum tabaci TaxID=1209068 RepID=A0AAV9TYV7_9PEZI
MEPSPEYNFDQIVGHIRSEIDEIKQLERKGLASEKKQCIEKLIAFVEDNNEGLFRDDGHTVLHRFLYDGSMAENCPPEVFRAILSYRPECILMYDDKEVPLVEFIRRRSETMTRAIIEFMASDVKSFSLAKLCEEVEDLFPDDYGMKERGREVVQAAFDFYDKGQLLPLDIELLEMLVRLATPDMLRKGLGSELSPLEQALRYDVSVKQPGRQLALVRLILDKCEESINDVVNERAKLKVGPGKTEVSPCKRSVYQWHVATRESWHRRRDEQMQSDANGITRPAGPQQANTNGGLLEERQRMKGTLLSKPGPPGKLYSIPGINSTAPMSRPEDASTSKHVRGLSSNLRPGPNKQHAIQAGQEKEGQHRPLQPRIGPMNRRMASETRVTKQEIDAADEASKSVLRELGLRFLRWTLFNRGSGDVTLEETMQSFFGTEKQHYYFAMDLTKVYQDMTEPLVKSYFSQRKHYHVLRHVVLPRARILLENESDKSTQLRYTDQLQFFRWFRSWGVEKILKVVVDDRAHPHRDEEIEEVLAGLRGKEPLHQRSFDVEVLDWRKEDLCPEVIRTAAPQVRELHLYWSGRNSVLRGWSEPEGLPLLESLRTVYLYYTQPSVSMRRVEANVAAFIERMMQPRPRPKGIATMVHDEVLVKLPQRQPTLTPTSLARQMTRTSLTETQDSDNLLPMITIHDMGQITVAGLSTSAGTAGLGTGAVEQPWFKYVEDFVSMIPPLPDSAYNAGSPHLRRVRVALIDDGVDIFDKGMRTLQPRFREGQSFDQTMPDGPNPVYSSVSGHGTFMAKSILRICPFADIVPYRLTTIPDPTGKILQPEPGSAAKAIRAAILQGVDIISMSWTIRKDDSEFNKPGMSELRRVVADARTARRRIPIMFCAASDDGNQARGGQHGKEELPRDMDKDIFCIGAADSSGQVWPKVTDQSGLHFIFPGVDIKDVTAGDDGVDGTGTGTGIGIGTGAGNSQLHDLLSGGSNNGRTGSSVATALAAGLAALLIHCTKLGLYYTREWRHNADRAASAETIIQPALVDQIASFAGMKSALDRLSTDSRSGTRYANPTEVFGRATQGLKEYEARGGTENNLPDSLGPIATLCRNLCEA